MARGLRCRKVARVAWRERRPEQRKRPTRACRRRATSRARLMPESLDGQDMSTAGAISGTIRRARCPFCREMFPVGALSPTTGMRVVRVLTFDDWDPQTNLTQIRIAGLVENKALAGLDRVPVAIAYECPRCSPSMWEAHSLLPLWVQQELDEVLLLMRIGAYSSTGIICRRFVERITTEHGAAGRGLKVRLEDLIRRKVLSGATLLWMERARERQRTF